MSEHEWLYAARTPLVPFVFAHSFRLIWVEPHIDMWMDILGGIVLYLALTAIVLGLISVAWPLRWLRIRTRRTAFAVMAAGILGFVVGLSPGPRNESLRPSYPAR